MMYLTLGWFPDGVVSLLTPRALASIAVRQRDVAQAFDQKSKTF
jgi:hypothetical protein